VRSYEEIEADARPGTAFSNGTSFEIWSAGWCERCKWDAAFQSGTTDQGCPLLLIAIMGKTPKEWTETGLQDYDCSEFVSDDDGDDGDGPETPDGPTSPAVEIDGQVDLFSVFADQIAEAPQQVPVGAL